MQYSGFLFVFSTSSLSFFFFKEYSFFKKFYLYIYFWQCWVFVSVRGLSLVAASGGHSSSRCAGLSLSRPLLLRSTGSRRAGSVIVAHGPSCSTACGMFPDRGSNPCPLHWQADSQPLRHQGSPPPYLLRLSHSHLIQKLCIWKLNNRRSLQNMQFNSHRITSSLHTCVFLFYVLFNEMP